MDGRPVWLATMTRRTRDGRIIPTGRWSGEEMAKARETMYDLALYGVGDPERERGFRMNASLFVQRALTDKELLQLPKGWLEQKSVDRMGAPIELLWSSVFVPTSLYPCERPGKKPLPNCDYDPDLWMPVDCGQCEPCRARS